MKLLKKIYNKLFINYKYISSLFDKQTNMLDKQNEKINNISRDFNEKIDSINEVLINLKNNIEKLNSKIEEYNYVNYELNSLNLIADSDKIKILLVGFYGAYNLGDDLMLKAMLNVLDTTKFDITVMLSRNSNIKVEDFNHVNCIYYPKKGNDFHVIASKFDKVIFGGGAIIDDGKFGLEDSFQYDLGTIFVYLSNEFILQNKEVYAIGLSSIKELTNQKYVAFLKQIIEKSKYFSVRDENSLKYLKSTFSTNKIKFIPDLVFSLEYNNFESVKNSNQVKSIGVIWICTNDTKEDLIKLLKLLKDYEVHLIPFYNYLNNDKIFFESIKANNNIVIEEFTNNIDELYYIYNKCDFIISMRYHGILLSYIFDKPTLAINYNLHEHYYNKVSYLTNLFSEEYINFSDLSNLDMLKILNKKNNTKKNIVLKQNSSINKEIMLIKESLSK